MAPVRRPARALVQAALIGNLTDLLRQQIVNHDVEHSTSDSAGICDLAEPVEGDQAGSAL
jgi:hypothetical protein